jgi:hypothetical protein
MLLVMLAAASRIAYNRRLRRWHASLRSITARCARESALNRR